jgi:Fe-S-cluster containining protein
VSEYDCRTCGLCCIADNDAGHYAYVDQRDICRMPPYYQSQAIPVYDRQLDLEIWGLGTKERDDGAHVCVAFEGQEGVSCRCVIYNARPQVCRDFEPGSRSCKDVREQHPTLGVSSSRSQKKTAKPSASSASTSGRTRT